MIFMIISNSSLCHLNENTESRGSPKSKEIFFFNCDTDLADIYVPDLNMGLR